MRRVCILILVGACGSGDTAPGVDGGNAADGAAEVDGSVPAVDAVAFDADPLAPDAAPAPDAGGPPPGFPGAYAVTLGSYVCSDASAPCCADVVQAGNAVLIGLTVPEYTGPTTMVTGESGWQWNFGNPSTGAMPTAPTSTLKLTDIHWDTQPGLVFRGPLTFTQQSNGDLVLAGPMLLQRWSGSQKSCEMTYGAPVFEWSP